MILVKLLGQKVGVLRESSRQIEFSYANDFLELGIELSPLLFPVQKGVFKFTNRNDKTFKGLPEFIADALPDKFGSQLINLYFTNKGVSSEKIGVLDHLSYMGSKAVGGLEFDVLESGMHYSEQESGGTLKISDIVQDARHVIQGNLQAVSSTFIRVGSIAGGAHPKALIAIHPETKEVYDGTGRVPKDVEHYLIKFDVAECVEGNRVEPQENTNIEYAYYLMAKDCGINMQPSFLNDEESSYSFMTLRFDREGCYKTHIQTMCGMTGIDFNYPHIAGYRDLFAVIVNLDFGMEDQKEVFTRMVFNVCALNYDAHTKNHSFVMADDGRWRLSPAYDLTYTFAQNTRMTGHFLLINGKATEITVKDMLIESSILCLSEAEKVNIIQKVSETILDGWSQYATRSDITLKKQLSIKSHLDAVNKNACIVRRVNGHKPRNANMTEYKSKLKGSLLGGKYIPDNNLPDAVLLKKLGEVLKNKRIQKNATQKALAAHSGASVDTIQRAESGKSVSTENLMRIMRSLEMISTFMEAYREPEISLEDEWILRQKKLKSVRKRVRNSSS